MKVNSPFSALWNDLGGAASLLISHYMDSFWQKVKINAHMPLKVFIK